MTTQCHQWKRGDAANDALLKRSGRVVSIEGHWARMANAAESWWSWLTDLRPVESQEARPQ